MQLLGGGEPMGREELYQCPTVGQFRTRTCTPSASLVLSISQTSPTIQEADPEDRRARAQLERTDASI